MQPHFRYIPFYVKIPIFFFARTIESWIKWMLDSQRTFKRKRGYLWQFRKFCLRQQLCAFKEFCMETRLSNIFKTTNVTNFTKAILKSFYRVLEVTSKWKTLKQPIYFLRAVEFCSTFDIQFDVTLAIFQEKLQNHISPTEVSQNMSKFISIRPPITK